MVLAVTEPAGAGVAPSPVDTALELLDGVYGFVYARVGNRADAEDLTQQVAMKALPKLRDGAPRAEINGYLFATARTVLATFWDGRSRFHELELDEELARDDRPSPAAPGHADESVQAILLRLRPSHRTLLELRFLRGYSLREVAAEMQKTIGAVKVMQLRALREAAALPDLADGPPACCGDAA